ncbi:MAG: hypothetical protein K2P70_17455 [Hyphomonadaceae bacterium]|nr:hypothetical protein [Hyphomonadaceae bacterium]
MNMEMCQRESRVRRRARKIGLALQKIRYRLPELRAVYSGYMLVTEDRVAVLGAHPHAYSANLDDIETYLREAS